MGNMEDAEKASFSFFFLFFFFHIFGWESGSCFGLVGDVLFPLIRVLVVHCEDLPGGPQRSTQSPAWRV